MEVWGKIFKRTRLSNWQKDSPCVWSNSLSPTFHGLGFPMWSAHVNPVSREKKIRLVQGHHLTQRAVLIKQDSGQILMIHQPRSWAILESFYSSCDIRLLSAPIWVATKYASTFWTYCGRFPREKTQLPTLELTSMPCIHMPLLRSERSPGIEFHVQISYVSYVSC